jgi:arylformamidase
VLDLSPPVGPATPVWPGDPAVELERLASIAGGDVVNVSRLSLSVHTGSHVDAPLHVADGAAAADALPLDVLVGPCVVVDARTVTGSLDAEAVAALAWPQAAERVLLATRNSELWARDAFSDDVVAFTGAGASAALDRGVRLLGIDYLTIGDEDAHRILLGPGVVVVEGLDLRGVAAGEYLLACLPLRLVGADGAPARVVLVDEFG